MPSLKPSLFVPAALALAVAAAPAGASVDTTVAAGPAGTAHFAWLQPGAFGSQIHERPLAAGGPLGDAQMVSPAFQTAETHALGVDAGGHATIAWTGVNGAGDLALAVRRRLDDGTLTARQQVSPSGANVVEPKLAVEPDGDAVLVWKRNLAGKSVVQARRRAADGALGTVHTLSYAGANAYEPDVAVSPSGTATVAWARATAVGERYVQARTVAPDDTLGDVQDLTAPAAATENVRVTMSDAGTAVVAWTRREGVGPQVVEARARSAAGALRPTQTVSTGAFAGVLRTAGNAAGRTAFIWIAADGGSQAIMGRIRQANGTLGPEFELRTGDVSHPICGIDPEGDATFGWVFDGERYHVQTKRRTAGGYMGPLRTVSDPETNALDPHLAVDGTGKATYAWSVAGGLVSRTLIPGGTFSPYRQVGGAAT